MAEILCHTFTIPLLSLEYWKYLNGSTHPVNIHGRDLTVWDPWAIRTQKKSGPSKGPIWNFLHLPPLTRLIHTHDPSRPIPPRLVPTCTYPCLSGPRPAPTGTSQPVLARAYTSLHCWVEAPLDGGDAVWRHRCIIGLRRRDGFYATANNYSNLYQISVKNVWVCRVVIEVLNP
jgi:hypothetical protein